VITKFQL